jgi:cobalt-zinc-cadmium resistance protein CzcA
MNRLALIMPLVLLSACGDSAPPPPALPPLIPATAVARPAAEIILAELPATVVQPPQARVAVAAPFAGMLREVRVQPGQAVRAGDVLATMISREALALVASLLLALALILALLVLTFRALRPAVLILLMVPFALVGGILALWASGEYLSVPASVGFIALLGIAVLNGLVMVSYIRQLRAAGVALELAVDQGARRRLRPVLMTASIAAFGLVPLLFATGPGSEIQKPLAIVVIGGLVSATLLTLVLLPLLYARFGEGTAA